MLLSQRPLTGSSVDAGLYVDRGSRSVDPIASGLTRGRNTMVLGERGSGRTSLLRQVCSNLESRGKVVAYVDAAPWAATRDLVNAIAAAMGADPRPETIKTYRSVDDDLAQEEREMHDIYEVVRVRPLNERDLAALMPDVSSRRARGARRPDVIAIDNLGGAPAHDLFGRFRDTIWQVPVTWVAVGGPDDSDLLAPPADVFWERVIVLDRLMKSEMFDLATSRIETAPEDDPDRLRLEKVLPKLVKQLHRPTPREVIAALAQALDGDDSSVLAGDPARVAAANAVAGKRGAALLYELEVLGRPAHAGDAQLLERSGISRARASQILNALEEEGLVRARDVSRRKMYEPVPLP